MEKTDPETIRQFLRELGSHLHASVKIAVGGSAALIIPGLLSRATTDIDVVDEVPPEIRTQRKVLEELRKSYGLILAHFQRHYLPMGWENRMHYLDTYGRLQVYLLDAYDIFLSKLFSIRTKDRSDLRMLAGQLDKEKLVRLLRDTTASMLVAPDLRERAEKNWYILFGDPLPA